VTKHGKKWGFCAEFRRFLSKKCQKVTDFAVDASLSIPLA
jgi:hypothetical protein